MKAAPEFPTEVSLCAAFIESVDKRKWTPYPETAGWDILMVRRADGFQVGIQAKLRLNTDVINQALDEYGHWSARKPGPDCRAVLVPSPNGFDRICKYLALVIVTVSKGGFGAKYKTYPNLPDAPPATQWDEWPEWAPSSRHKLPEYVPDVPAGASGPVQLTDWKIRAIKLAVLLENQGSVRRTDFAYLQLDPRRWVEGQWLTLKDGAYAAGPGLPQFKGQHPKVYAKIAGEFEKWKQKPDRDLLT